MAWSLVRSFGLPWASKTHLQHALWFENVQFDQI